jgi:hypothetical protein
MKGLGVKMMKFKLRLISCYRILFCKWKHWVIINIDQDNLIHLLKEETFGADILYHGVQPYIAYRMIKMVGNSQDDIDMALGKAEFQANAENNG